MIPSAALTMEHLCNRREALGLATGTLLLYGTSRASGRDERLAAGRVEGWPEAATAGEAVLAAGGNAVDAIVAAALVASVAAPQMCSPSGYGAT